MCLNLSNCKALELNLKCKEHSWNKIWHLFSTRLQPTNKFAKYREVDKFAISLWRPNAQSFQTPIIGSRSHARHVPSSHHLGPHQWQLATLRQHCVLGELINERIKYKLLSLTYMVLTKNILSPRLDFFSTLSQHTFHGHSCSPTYRFSLKITNHSSVCCTLSMEWTPHWPSRASSDTVSFTFSYHTWQFTIFIVFTITTCIFSYSFSISFWTQDLALPQILSFIDLHMAGWKTKNNNSSTTES